MTKVSRSVYQKLKEENKKLLLDIRLLCETNYLPSPEKILVIAKWQKTFKKEKEFNNMIKLACRTHIKNNPEDPAVIGFHKIKTLFNQ